MKDKASRMVNHIESTIEIQRNAVFPVHFAGGSISYLGDSSSPRSTASSVKVATAKTTPSSPSIAKVTAWASLATKTAVLDASLSKLHSTPETLLLNIPATAARLSSHVS
nr:hypothetical protein Iba_scaffold40678CG0010 [Ipomoea batatas]GMD42095.1 hypothetical protein Iba_chr10bCG6050 [Ipomoea batatas]GMD43657.1 hypothetical protein Iba_chr10cCG7420 [Ipomoea batatas]